MGVGYVKCEGDRIDKDPDRRVREAMSLIFRKFAELQTVRQVLVWIRQEQILLPVLQQGPGKQPILWKAPVYHTLHHILTNPVCAGAYAFERRGTTVALVEGRKRMIRTVHRTLDSWEVLIKDHHEGYISWEEFARNQEIIADNANGKSISVAARFAGERLCYPDCFDVADAAGSSRCIMAAGESIPSATLAVVLSVSGRK